MTTTNTPPFMFFLHPKEWWGLYSLPLNLGRPSQPLCPIEHGVSDVCDFQDYFIKMTCISAFLLLDTYSFLEQSHHTMRKPNNHVKGPPTGASAKNPSCCHDRKPTSAVRHVREWTCRWVQPSGIKSLPAFRLFQLSWYHAEHRHAVPAESFPNYRFVNKINGHWCFKPLSLGHFVT